MRPLLIVTRYKMTQMGLNDSGETRCQEVSVAMADPGAHGQYQQNFDACMHEAKHINKLSRDGTFSINIS